MKFACGKSNIRLAMGALAPFVLALGLGVSTQAQTYTVITDMPDTAPWANPGAGLIVQGRNGDLYSTTPLCAVFSITTGGTYNEVYPVCGNPYGGVTLGSDGNLYGGDTNGGTESCGAVYKVTPAGAQTVLHNFQCSDGYEPIPAPVEASNGLFYGVTFLSSSGYGVLYSVNSTGTEFKVLHTFAGGNSDGAYPHAQLVLGSDGNLYGGTSAGGPANWGVLFRLTPSGQYTVLYNMCSQSNCADGADIEDAMTVGDDGNLYGVTYRGGGYGQGTVFRLTNGGMYNPIYSPQPGQGVPNSKLTLGSDGKFYGITTTFSSAPTWIYSVTTGGVYTHLHQFCQLTNCTDGNSPSTPLVQSTDGTFFGFASTGGKPNQCNSGIGCGLFYSLNMGLKPFIRLLSTSGKVGSTVQIQGQDFTKESVVKFNGVTAKTVVLASPAFLTATVPTGANDGYVTVTTETTTLTSSQKYIVHNSWGSGKAIPTPVNYPAGTGVVGAKIYVVGGATASGNITTNQVYNTATSTWSTEEALPKALAGGSAAVVKNILYVFGGYSGSTAGSAVDSVWAYNPATNKWTAEADMPTARGSSTAVVDGTTVYVIGGNGSTLRLDTVDAYDTLTNTWSAKAPLLTGKSDLSGGLQGTTVLATDGYNASTGDNGDNEAYDVSTNSWSTHAADPEPRSSMCYGTAGNVLYVAGGTNSNNTPLNTTESFSAGTDKWTTLAAEPVAAVGPGSAIVGGQLYCISGSSSSGLGLGTIHNNVQIYQP